MMQWFIISLRSGSFLVQMVLFINIVIIISFWTYLGVFCSIYGSFNASSLTLDSLNINLINWLHFLFVPLLRDICLNLNFHKIHSKQILRETCLEIFIFVKKNLTSKFLATIFQFIFRLELPYFTMGCATVAVDIIW